MTATTTPANAPIRPARWLASFTVSVMIPKCLLCVWGYAGLGIASGLGGAEICGKNITSFAPWKETPTVVVGGFTLFALITSFRCLRRRG